MTAQVCSLFHSSPSANNGEQTAGLLAANKHQSVVTTATRYIDSISRSTYGQRREATRRSLRPRVSLRPFFFFYPHSISRPTSSLHFRVFFTPLYPSICLSLSLFYFIGLQWPPFSCLSPKKKRSLLNRG